MSDPTPTHEGLVARICRLLAGHYNIAKMTITLAAGAIGLLGIEKVLIIPIFVQYLGKDQTGQLLLAQAWMTTLLTCVGTGFSDSQMRLYKSAEDRSQGKQLLGISIVLVMALSFLLLLLACGSYWLMKPAGWHIYLPLMIPMGLYALFQTMRPVLVLPYRVNLRFLPISGFDLLAGMLLLIALPLGLLWGPMAAGWGFAFAMFLAMALLLRSVRQYISLKQAPIRYWCGQLLRTAPMFVPVALVTTAVYQAARLTLGSFCTTSDVVAFFAMESVLGLMVMPLTYLSSVIYSMLSRKGQIHDIHRRSILQHVFTTLACAVLYAVAAVTLGPLVLKIMYRQPDLLDQISGPFKLMSVGVSFRVLSLFSRPFLFKFHKMRTVAILPVITFTVLVTLLLVLVPHYGLWGAAWAVACSNVVQGLIWFGPYLWLVLSHKQTLDKPASPELQEEGVMS